MTTAEKTIQRILKLPYEVIQMELDNGNIITYKIISGTAFHINTPIEVCHLLNNSRENRNRIRIFYGDIETGRDWCEEWHTIGYIGRSTGSVKIPLLISSERSHGGPALLDHCIIKVTMAAGGRVLYCHPLYNHGSWTVESTGGDLREKGYFYGAYRDGAPHANFKTLNQARRYVNFITGNRNNK